MIIKDGETQELIENLYSMIAKLSDKIYDLEQSNKDTKGVDND
jgi:predicted site-specific integrase-resolvase